MTGNSTGIGLRVALLSSCNLDMLVKPLLRALDERGVKAAVWKSGFNQYCQDLLDGDSAFYAEKPDAILLFLEAADIFADVLRDPFALDEQGAQDLADRSIEQVFSLVNRVRQSLPKSTVYLNTLSLDGLNALYGIEYNSRFSLKKLIGHYNLTLAKMARKNENVVIADVDSLAAAKGLERWYDRRFWHLARIRHSSEAHTILADEYANLIAARLGRRRKCIVLDLDNTLWGGVVGEEGLEGIALGREGVGLAFAEFQDELLNLYRKGVLLAICSKNNEEDALEVIRRHAAMELREEHFAAMRLNWNDKAQNIREIARELNIGLDSLVFVDDNPVERARISEALPEVYVPEWPTDCSDYKHVLLTVARRMFLTFRITDEDRQRGEMYRVQAEREKLVSTAASLEDFYRSLEMELTIGTADRGTIPRIAQLTQKTNQFNVTTRRYTEPEITEMANSDDTRVYWLDVSDRFGPNGIVGALIAKRDTVESWKIDTFLMSCRIIGRTVENAMLAYVMKELRAEGVRTFFGEFIPTAKNGIVSDLYPRLGFVPLQHGENVTRWALDISTNPIKMPDWFKVKEPHKFVARTADQ